MDTRKIILSKLKFLIDDYGFAFYFEENEGNHFKDGVLRMAKGIKWILE